MKFNLEIIMEEILQSATLEYSCDSIESCPYPGLQDLFICGSYFLDATTQQKHGNIHLYQITHHYPSEEHLKEQQIVGFTERQVIDTGALLDAKWSYSSLEGKNDLAVACSNGNLDIYSLNVSYSTEEGKKSFNLRKTRSLCIDSNSICLSLDWNNRIYQSESPKIVVSHSDGGISLNDVSEGGITTMETWKGHDFEAWIAAFDHFDPNTVFTGGDDCRFKAWDVRSECRQPLFSKLYDMGVTTIQCNPHKEHHVAVGSYNDKITYWDTRSIRSPLFELELGGGIWRVKWNPKHKDLIAVACMRTGFKILKVSDSETSCSVVDEYRKHCEPIAYGIDWIMDNRYEHLVGTCSFYDKQCAIWQPKLE